MQNLNTGKIGCLHPFSGFAVHRTKNWSVVQPPVRFVKIYSAEGTELPSKYIDLQNVNGASAHYLVRFSGNSANVNIQSGCPWITLFTDPTITEQDGMFMIGFNEVNNTGLQRSCTITVYNETGQFDFIVIYQNSTQVPEQRFDWNETVKWVRNESYVFDEVVNLIAPDGVPVLYVWTDVDWLQVLDGDAPVFDGMLQKTGSYGFKFHVMNENHSGGVRTNCITAINMQDATKQIDMYIMQQPKI